MNDVAYQAISGVSDKDPDKEYLVAAYNEAVKEFKKTAAYARLPETEEEAHKKKRVRQSGDEDGQDDDVTPIQELLDCLPVFDATS